MSKILTIIALLGAVFFTAELQAQTSNLSIQGILRAADGTAVEDGSYQITFKLYLQANTGEPIWEEIMDNVPVNGGVYSVILGAGGTPLTAAFDEPYYLGVTVGDPAIGIELTPRARLTSSPYALSLIGDDNIFPNSGNVGVGAADPQNKLTVQRGDGFLGLEAVEDANNTAIITSKADGLEFSTEGASNAYYFAGEVTEVMRIKKDGKVGIGTDDPQNTLHIVGDNEQVKVEGTDNANIVFTKTSGSATLGFDAAGGDDLKLSNPLGATKIEGSNITLNTSSGTATIEGNTVINGTVEVTKEGEALKLAGTTNNTQLAFYPTGIAGGKTADVGVASNGELLVNSTNSNIVISPGAGKRVRTIGMLHASSNEYHYTSQNNHILEHYTSSSYAIRQNARHYHLSIYADNGVRADHFVISSDKRIKKDLSLSNGQKDLLTLSKIEVTDYRHIDEVANGAAMRKGVIAQQVDAVFPEAISKGPDFIPNVYEAPTALSLENGNLKVRLSKNHDFEVGDKIKVGTLNGSQEVLVSSIISPQEFSIDNWEGSDNEKDLFIVGKEIDDFHTVDYDRIFTLNVSATQELARKVEALEKENARLKSTNADSKKSNDALKAEVRSMNARLESIESMFSSTGSN